MIGGHRVGSRSGCQVRESRSGGQCQGEGVKVRGRGSRSGEGVQCLGVESVGRWDLGGGGGWR